MCSLIVMFVVWFVCELLSVWCSFCCFIGFLIIFLIFSVKYFFILLGLRFVVKVSIGVCWFKWLIVLSFFNIFCLLRLGKFILSNIMLKWCFCINFIVFLLFFVSLILCLLLVINLIVIFWFRLRFLINKMLSLVI